ncbi:MAG: hypothetical protein ACKVS9_19150 [Phycisphaerae bacterium]
MMHRACRSIITSAVALLCPLAVAQSYQVIVAETPVGAGGGQPVRRYLLTEPFAIESPVTSIPGASLNDPVSVAFRSPLEAFIGNRAAHSGNGSVQRCTFSPDLTTVTIGALISGNSITDCAQIAFSPVDGELFVTNFTGGMVSRFVFDGADNALANGTIQMPDGANQLGIAFRPADQQLFVSSYTFIRRFSRNLDGTYSYIGNFGPGTSSIHFMRFKGDELYVCDIAGNSIFRYRFDASGVPYLHKARSFPSPIDVAFSPDDREMYVSSHFGAGINRYNYIADNDEWEFLANIATPQLGGIAVTRLAVCQGDLDNDRRVNLTDLAILLSNFGQPSGAVFGDGDIDDDGAVTLTDLALLLSQFGTSCG